MKFVVNTQDAKRAIISAMDRILPLYPKGHEYDSECEDCGFIGAEDETTFGYLSNVLNKFDRDENNFEDITHDLIVANARLEHSAMNMNMAGDAERAYKAHEDIESAILCLYRIKAGKVDNGHCDD